jgi:hypothetical protein
MNNTYYSKLLLSLFLACVALNDAVSQKSVVVWSTFDMGFGVSSSVNTMVKSAVGQTFVGKSELSTTKVESGFLADTSLRGFLLAANDETNLPLVFALRQNYPNPFNPSTTIRYELPEAAYVAITIYNMLGQRVTMLVDEQQSAGFHQVKFDASGIASGIYFYRMQAGTYTATKKLLLLR